MAARLVIRQPGADGDGDFWNEWHCDPPPPGTPFTVIRARWTEDDGERVRQVFEIRSPSDSARTAPSPGLGEEKLVSETDDRCPDCGREDCTGEDCYWPDEAGISRPEREEAAPAAAGTDTAHA